MGMKNIPSVRTLKGPSTIKGSMRPFYQHAWPDDLPPHCSLCGTEFRTGWNISVGPNRIGRFLRKAAYWSFLPSVLGFLVLPDLLSRMLGGWFVDQQGLLTLFMLVAPILLATASFFTPITRHLECKKCGWNRDYPGVKPTPIPPPQA